MVGGGQLCLGRWCLCGGSKNAKVIIITIVVIIITIIIIIIIICLSNMPNMPRQEGHHRD